MLQTTLPSTGFIPSLLSGRAASEWGITSARNTRLLNSSLAEGWLLSTNDLMFSSAEVHLMLCGIAAKTTNVTAPIEERLNWLVAKSVMIENPSDVRTYLLQYSDLLIIIPQVWKKASELLSPCTQFTLAVYRDPEIRDEYLTLYARQREYEENILKSIDSVNSFCEEMLSGIAGWLITTTDFRSPK